MQWDDLRYVLAVHSAGSVAAAAAQLGVSNVTVFRRLKAIEKQLGVRLFDRTRKGYVVTPPGLEIVRQAERIEETVGALERRIWRQDKQLQGVVRVTAPDTVGAFVLTPLIPELHKLHPGIRIELKIDNRLLDISRRDADIAVRTTARPPDNLIGHRVAPLVYAAYAARERLPGGKATAAALAEMPWVGLDDSVSGARVTAYQNFMATKVPPERVILRANNPLTLALAIKAGIGAGVLACVTATGLGGLVRIGPLIDEISTDLWVLTHPELRDVARVTAVYSYFRDAITRLRPMFLGEEARDTG